MPRREAPERAMPPPEHPWNRLRRATGCVPPPGGSRAAAQGGYLKLRIIKLDMVLYSGRLIMRETKLASSAHAIRLSTML
jgi:hypothetical protein